MISRDELLEQAKIYQLNHADVQRDYLFGWLISGIYRTSQLGETLTLKGGNALRKGYLSGTRFSDDLDFTTERGLNADELMRQLNEVFRALLSPIRSRSRGAAMAQRTNTSLYGTGSVAEAAPVPRLCSITR